MNKKGGFSSNFCSWGRFTAMFCIYPRGEGKRTDISAITGAIKMSFDMNTNRPPSNAML